MTPDDIIVCSMKELDSDNHVPCFRFNLSFAQQNAKSETEIEFYVRMKQQILTALDLYNRLGEWKDGIKDGLIHVMPEERYQQLFHLNECAVNLMLCEDDRRELKQENYRLQQIKQRLENEITNTENYYGNNMPDSIKHHIDQCKLILKGASS